MEALDLTQFFRAKYPFTRSRDVRVDIQHAVAHDGYWLIVSERVDGVTFLTKRLMGSVSALTPLMEIQFMRIAIGVLMRELTVQYKNHKRRATPHVR
jgi:hypothetical protein